MQFSVVWPVLIHSSGREVWGDPFLFAVPGFLPSPSVHPPAEGPSHQPRAVLVLGRTALSTLWRAVCLSVPTPRCWGRLAELCSLQTLWALSAPVCSQLTLTWLGVPGCCRVTRTAKHSLAARAHLILGVLSFEMKFHTSALGENKPQAPCATRLWGAEHFPKRH